MNLPHESVPMTLSKLRLSPLVVVAEADTLAAVAREFRALHVSCAILREPPVRFVTEFDLAGEWADGWEAEDEVAVIATPDPYWVPATATTAEAAAAMVNLGVRHLVVMNGARSPIGVVSMSDLFSAMVPAHGSSTLYGAVTTLVL
jgi:signal-transduction protein with cAMP-binding, CBS, and nucleotidyltransferase domain